MSSPSTERSSPLREKDDRFGDKFKDGDGDGELDGVGDTDRRDRLSDDGAGTATEAEDGA